jgi:TPR repeat protein
MATPTSPERVHRQPVAAGSPVRLYSDGEGKENTGNIDRKPLLSIPIPSSGRIHGAPMSPVKVNVQPDDWLPRASSAMIEDGNSHLQQVSQKSEQFGPEQRESAEPRMPITVDIPHRPNYTQQHKPEQIQQPHAAHLSSGDSGSSRSPSSASSTYQGAIKRASKGRVDENGYNSAPSPVPQLQYHHQPIFSDSGNSGNQGSAPSNVHPHPQDLVNVGQAVNRNLTPTSQTAGRTPIQRPMSAYSDMGPRGRSPGGPISGSPNWGVRAPSAHSGRSHESRPISYIDLANISYPQAPPAPISLDNSQLRSVVGSNASLLTMGQTLEMYRQNVKKLNDAETQYAFAIYLIQAAQEGGTGADSGNPSLKPGGNRSDSPYVEKVQTSPQELLSEAKHILQKLSDKAYPFAQYYLADGYASGLFNKGKEDYGQAFPLFVAASKHGHAESGYRAALCYEFGWGCRKDPAKAVQFYRQSASKNHPGAMTRLGRACLSGDLGLNKYREGLKWLKRATESADLQYNAAPYHLGLLYETGYGDDVFQDEVYAAQLFTQAADLGHAEASYRLGDAYEHGKLSCPQDPALSVHFYTGAAQRGHPAAMMALCAWYMVGAEPVLEKDENEAYEWARQAAECGMAPVLPPIEDLD